MFLFPIKKFPLPKKNLIYLDTAQQYKQLLSTFLWDTGTFFFWGGGDTRYICPQFCGFTVIIQEVFYLLKLPTCTSFFL